MEAKNKKNRSQSPDSTEKMGFIRRDIPNLQILCTGSTT